MLLKIGDFKVLKFQNRYLKNANIKIEIKLKINIKIKIKIKTNIDIFNAYMYIINCKKDNV